MSHSGTVSERAAADRPPRLLSYRHFVVYLVFAWGVQDTITTLLAAAAVGPGMEINPVVRLTLEADPMATVAFKLGLALVAGVAALWGERFITGVPYWQFWFAQLTLLGVVVSAVNLVVAWNAVALVAATISG